MANCIRICYNTNQYATLPTDDKSSAYTNVSKVTASEVHRGFGKLLRRVYKANEPLIVEHDGFPMAVLMPIADFQQYRRLKALKDHKELTKKLGEEAEKQGLTEEQLIKEIRETRKQLFNEKYGNLLPKK